MPYKSDKQRKFMHAKHPDIAAKWDEKYGGKVKKSAWGVITKGSPDQSAVHVMGSAGSRKTKRKLKRVTEDQTGGD
jgi:hypothetical protein